MLEKLRGLVSTINNEGGSPLSSSNVETCPFYLYWERSMEDGRNFAKA
jgi:hypothetical protein